MKIRNLVAATSMVLTGSVAAYAEESMRTLAQSGEWAAVAHSVSLMAAPDTCLAFNMASGLLLRLDAASAEVRFTDKTWSLPADVEGSISLIVGDWQKTYSVDHNTSIMVVADVGREELTAMLAAMDKATSMTVAVGKSKPKAVSLAGSTKVTNAFRTCASLKGNAESGGANPFK